MHQGGGGNRSHFVYICSDLSLEPYPYKGQLFVKNIPLRGNISLKGIIYYENHTHKRDKTCKKSYPLGADSDFHGRSVHNISAEEKNGTWG